MKGILCDNRKCCKSCLCLTEAIAGVALQGTAEVRTVVGSVTISAPLITHHYHTSCADGASGERFKRLCVDHIMCTI